MAYRKNILLRKLPIAMIALLCAATPTFAVPTRATGRSNTMTENASGSETSNCNTVLSSSQIQSLRTEIVASASALIAALGDVHVWSSTVSLFHNKIKLIIITTIITHKND